MTLSRGLDGAAGGLRRAVAAGCVAVAIFAGVWTGPAALASVSVPRSAAAVATAPATVKYACPARTRCSGR
jgi:hypothetical protein